MGKSNAYDRVDRCDLQSLAADERTSLTDEIRQSIDEKLFSSEIAGLSRFRFWDGGGSGQQLWEHQRAAIGTAVAYLAADPKLLSRPDHREAALLKLPTGTGKSAIVAVLARCLFSVKSTLVLTPREALASQLHNDVRYRFWARIGLSNVQEGVCVADAKEVGSELEPISTQLLLPSQISEALEEPKHSRRMLIGTHQALEAIRRLSRSTAKEHQVRAAQARDLIAMLQSFDLVIVDEGHYEPAVTWSKGVRDLNLRTVLLSATPYRNDYKAFRVAGRFVFNFPHHQAVQRRIIRDVNIVSSKQTRKPTGSAMAAFVETLAAELPPVLKIAKKWVASPKVMVRADDIDALISLQKLIDRTFKTQSVVIHHAVKGNQRSHRAYAHVDSAQKECGDAQFWLHQSKLMEGVDDPSYVALAIFDLMSNDRQLIQQIGRVVRTTPSRVKRQTAWVIAGSGNSQRIEQSWAKYKEFEEYCARSTGNVVVNEAALPDRLLESMPDVQYVDGQFKRRFEPDAPLVADDIQLPASSVVLEREQIRGDLSSFIGAMEDSLLEQDRFKVLPISGLPHAAVGFTYYGWRNSPYLREHFFSEWTLGVFLAVEEQGLVFMQDTGGLVIDLSKLGMRRASRESMERAFPAKNNRLTRMSFNSLDLSDNGIRTMAVRTRRLDTTFTDLLDPYLVPTAASGFVEGRARYIGFARSRIRDGVERYLDIATYLAWIRSTARALATKAVRRSAVFDRYAQVRDDVGPDEAVPVSILVDFARDEFLEGLPDTAEARTLAADSEVESDDLCADVSPDGNFSIRVLGKQIGCSIVYVPDSGRYKFQSNDLNDLFSAAEAGDRRHARSASQRINASQSFRILVEKPGVVYAEGRFFQARLNWKAVNGEISILDDVTAISELGAIRSEKGEKIFGQSRIAREEWRRGSLFGVIESACEGGLKNPSQLDSAVAAYPLVVCDDGADEIADFIAVDQQKRRVAFVHAKADRSVNGGYSVGALQAVGRQVLASLTFMSSAPPSKWKSSRWTRNVQANDIQLKGRGRIFRNVDGLSADEITEQIVGACGNMAFQREIWIVAGNLVCREALRERIVQDSVDNRLRQFLMHWDALRTACARASVGLRLFCH